MSDHDDPYDPYDTRTLWEKENGRSPQTARETLESGLMTLRNEQTNCRYWIQHCEESLQKEGRKLLQLEASIANLEKAVERLS